MKSHYLGFEGISTRSFRKWYATEIYKNNGFDIALSRPTITIQSTPKAYGHFSLRGDTWISKIGATHEINIGAGTLARPIEDIFASRTTAYKYIGLLESGMVKY